MDTRGAPSSDSYNSRKLVIVSNRLPIKVDCNGKYSPTTGGLASALSGLTTDTSSLLWLGWNGSVVDPGEQETVRTQIRNATLTEGPSDSRTPLRYEPVFLTKDQVKGYYDGYANATLWPILHYFTSLAKYSDEWFRQYSDVNRQFCTAVLELVQPGDLVWIHDYHLFLLPAMLREKMPELKIGFFLHVPFSSYEVFRCIPQRKQLLEGLLGADLLGFHTFNYVRHFKSAVLRCLELECNFDTINLDGRTVRLGIHPIGINWQGFKAALETDEYRKSLAEYASEFSNRKLVLSVSRLDYTKGIPAMLEAIEFYLEHYPHGNDITFLVIAVPSRDNVQSYIELKERVIQIIGEINGKYSKISCSPPVQFINYSVNPNKLAALYALADVALVIPLIDGMNLVAKEFISVQPATHDQASLSRPGCLILSEFTGAAQELFNSLIVNPYDTCGVAEAIHRGLKMSPSEKLTINSAMQKRVREQDATYWATRFLEHMRQESPVPERPKPLRLDDIVDRFRIGAEGRKVLFLDYDGTLPPMLPLPHMANTTKFPFRGVSSRSFSPVIQRKSLELIPNFIRQRLTLPSKNLLSLLQKLSTRADLDIVILTGRGAELVEQHLGHLGLTLIAEHGHKIKRPGEAWREYKAVVIDWKDLVLPYLELYMRDTPGSFIEEKRSGLVWHYRQSEPELGHKRAVDLFGQLSEFIHNLPVELHHGAKSVEVRSIGLGKGRVVEDLMAESDYTVAMCIGNETTDEGMCRVPNDKLLKIKVGGSHATLKWQKPEEVLEFLASI